MSKMPLTTIPSIGINTGDAVVYAPQSYTMDDKGDIIYMNDDDGKRIITFVKKQGKMKVRTIDVGLIRVDFVDEQEDPLCQIPKGECDTCTRGWNCYGGGSRIAKE